LEHFLEVLIIVIFIRELILNTHFDVSILDLSLRHLLRRRLTFERINLWIVLGRLKLLDRCLLLLEMAEVEPFWHIRRSKGLLNLVLWKTIEVPEARALDLARLPFLFSIWGLQLLGSRERQRSLELSVLKLPFCYWWKGPLVLWLLAWMILVEIWLDKVDRSPLTVDHELFEHADDQFLFLAAELLLALVLRNVRREQLSIELLDRWLQILIF
jgi:hypothetical protein